ncbi:MAG: chorismate synthase [Pseudomonadota bacterium]
MNTTGRLFSVTLLGTSRGPGVASVVAGCPAGLPLCEEDFGPDLARRRGGQPGTTARAEPDSPRLLAGVFEGRTTGQPLVIAFENTDPGPDGPDHRLLPRPGHADLAATLKYGGFHDPRGGGAFSGRLTAGLVAAGVIAKRLLPGLLFSARVLEVGGRADVDAALAEALAAGDSLGGWLECRVAGVPAGWGEPLLDPLDGRLAQVAFSIPGIRAFEIGDGRAIAALRGSETNDPILAADGRAASNRAGGVSGGISNGNPLVFRVAARPTPSVPLAQRTVRLPGGEPATVSTAGRHDACFALRLPVVLEAAAAVVLADFARLAGALGPVWAG